MINDMPIFSEGDVLDGDFQIARLVDNGGFGQIYEAQQISLGYRKVAVKVEAYNPYWQNDGQVLATISSRHYLPEVYKKFEIQYNGKNFVCLVMQFVDGGTMKKNVEKIGEHREIDINRIFKWMDQLCRALEELHGKDIVHADVKPGNIIIDVHDNVCLIDFNTAIINGRISVAGLCVSKGYAPPEQYPKAVSATTNKQSSSSLEMFGASKTKSNVKYIHGTADKRSDIYAAGAVLYYLMFKRRPPSSEGRTSKKFILETSALVSEYAPLYKIIETATALNPDDRYKSAAEMRKALEKARKQVNFGVKKIKALVVAGVFAALLAIAGGGVAAAVYIRGNQAIEAGAFNYYEEGRSLIEQGNFEEAKRIYDANINEYNKPIFLYALRAETLCENGEYELYLKEYASFPDDIKNYSGKYKDFYAQMLYYLGDAYYYTGDSTAALDYYKGAISADDEKLNYKLALMRTLAVLGESAELEEVKSRLPEGEISSEWLSFYDGVAKKVEGDLTASEESFLKAIITDDEQLLWAVVYELSDIYSKTAQDEKQIAFLSDKRNLFTGNNRTIIINERLGESLRRMQRYDEALVCFEYLVQVQPYSYRTHELLAISQGELKLYEEQKITLDKMIELSPQNVKAYILYIGLLLQLEEEKPYADRNYNAAYEMFKKGESIDATNTDIVIYRDVFDNLLLSGSISR